MKLILAFVLLASGAFAQWSNYATPGIPRLPSGKADLARRRRGQ